MTTNEEWTHPKCGECDEEMMLDSSEPYCQSCEDKNGLEEKECCVKCNKSSAEKNEGWVECSCSAHTGWYCDSCSPGNECYDDEECDCCNPVEVEFYEVSCAENPDVEYFNTLENAKEFCDKHDALDYGMIMLCDKNKKHIGDWGDYEEDE